MTLPLVPVTSQSWEAMTTWFGAPAAKRLLNPTTPTTDGVGVCQKIMLHAEAVAKEFQIFKINFGESIMLSIQ